MGSRWIPQRRRVKEVRRWAWGRAHMTGDGDPGDTESQSPGRRAFLSRGRKPSDAAEMSKGMRRSPEAAAA